MRRIHELLDQWIETQPHGLACIDPNDRYVSFKEMGDAVDEAVRLLTEKGIRGGDRLMLVVENSVEAIAFLLASSRLDVWAVMVNARLTDTEIEKIRNHARPRVIIFSHEISEAARSHGLSANGVEYKGSYGRVQVSVQNDAGEPEPVERAATDQVAVLLYTTGTTGTPKGVMLTHNNLFFAAKISSELRQLGLGDHLLLVLPLTHVFGLVSVTLAALHGGTTVELMTRFEPGVIFEALETRVTSFPAVPQMYALLMKYAREQGIDKLNAKKLRYLSSGGAPLDPDWKMSVESFLGQSVFNGYGLTETSAGIAATRPGTALEDVSVGKPLPGHEIKLIPPPGQDELKEGVGEVLIRGPNVMKGYYKNSEETLRVLDGDGWFHSGDLGLIDTQGNLSIVGRCKELIIRSGFNIYPPEVEAALTEHPSVVQAAVIGKSEANGNEEVLAFVEVLDGSQIEGNELLDFTRDRLAAYKRPSRIFVVDKLPAASTGKILKYKLLDDFADLL